IVPQLEQAGEESLLLTGLFLRLLSQVFGLCGSKQVSLPPRLLVIFADFLLITQEMAPVVEFLLVCSLAIFDELLMTKPRNCPLTVLEILLEQVSADMPLVDRFLLSVYSRISCVMHQAHLANETALNSAREPVVFNRLLFNARKATLKAEHWLLLARPTKRFLSSLAYSLQQLCNDHESREDRLLLLTCLEMLLIVTSLYDCKYMYSALLPTLRQLSHSHCGLPCSRLSRRLLKLLVANTTTSFNAPDHNSLVS
ncbi:hypothetical protein Ciccas_014418, partial [Cichlidogyrus casuarinus]